MRTFNGLLGIILISALGGSVAYYLPATRAQDLSADQQLLVNIKAHIREELYRLPDYTCLALAGIPGTAATQVFGMNTNGDLVGTYTSSFSGLRGFTATPVPESSSFSLVAAFVGVLAFCVAKRHGLECKPRSLKCSNP